MTPNDVAVEVPVNTGRNAEGDYRGITEGDTVEVPVNTGINAEGDLPTDKNTHTEVVTVTAYN